MSKVAGLPGSLKAPRYFFSSAHWPKAKYTVVLASRPSGKIATS